MPRPSHTLHVSFVRRATGRWAWCLFLAALLAFPCGTAVRAEDESGALGFPETEDEPEPVSSGYKSKSGSSAAKAPQPDKMSGVDGRIGFIGLPTFGRDDSIVPIELFPYLQMDKQILFGDFRGFIGTNGKVGGNAGVGFRFIEPNDIALFGVNGFYDADNTTGKTFQQLSVGWEARTRMLGTFGNVYIPVGKTDQVISSYNFNERFDNHSILFDVSSLTGQSMSGMDLNVQAFLPGDFAQAHQIQATAGWYSFQANNVDSINGYKMQLQGNIVPALTMLTMLTHDKTFGTNFSIGGFFRFGTRELPDIDLNGQLRRFVDRNYNVIVSQKREIQSGLQAINPLTGNAYVVQHVGANGGVGTGTEADPYTSVADAQNAPGGADIIFVEQGTTLNESIVLANGQSLFGEGANVTVNDSRYGAIRLPGAASTGATPIITSPGDGVTMANNTRLAGFMIQDTIGRGIVANNVNKFKIEDVKIDNAGAEGIWVSDSQAGTISDVTITGGASDGIAIIGIDDVLTLNDIYINGVAGNGVNIGGGHGSIYFHDDLIVQNAGQAAFAVSNLETQVVVDDRGTPSVADDITTTTTGLVSVDKLVVRNTTGGKGISLDHNEGIIGFSAVDIETANASSVYVRDTENMQILNGYLTSTNAAAADIDGSGINIALTKLQATGGTNGLRFVDTTGQFTVYGTGSLGTGGKIMSTNTAIYMEDGPGVALQTVDFTGNGTVAYVNGGDSLIIAGSNITQTANTIIDATNLNMLQVYDSQFTNNALSSGTGILFQANTTGSYTASVTNNTVVDAKGTFFKTQTLAGGEGASLAYSFQSNDVALGSANGIAASVDWTGPLTAYMISNKITGSLGNQTALQLHTGTSTSQAQGLISQNAITLAGDSSTGVDIDMGATSTLYVTSNAITFNGLNGVGIRSTLRKAGGMNVSGNTIIDNLGGATGILFDSVEHLSTLVLNANAIDLSHASTFVDRGIVLSAISNADANVTDPFVTFVSTSSNTVQGATTSYTLPATGARGTLLINNISVQ